MLLRMRAVTLTSGATQTLLNFGYRVLKSGSTCTPTAITPYVAVNRWRLYTEQQQRR